MNVVSNFKDYYDSLSDSSSNVVYKRNINCESKVKELEELRKTGIKTIEIKPISKMIGVDKVIVYTDLTKHCGNGKIVMDLDGARLMYPNKLCTEFISEVNKTYKLLQIGTRTFRCVIKNKMPLKTSVDERDIFIEEVNRIKIRGIDYPVYSIDYIRTNNGMLACDFNKVEILNRLRMNRYLTAKEVVGEIEKILRLR